MVTAQVKAQAQVAIEAQNATNVQEEQLKLEKDKLEFKKSTKDRADISLTAYFALKSDLERAKDEARYWERLFQRMGFPKLSELRINPDSLHVRIDNGMAGTTDPLNARTVVHIMFTTPDFLENYEDKYREGVYKRI